MTNCTGGVISSGFVVSLPTTVGRFFIKKKDKKMTVKEMIKILSDYNPDFNLTVDVGNNRYTVGDSQIVAETIDDGKVIGGTLSIVVEEMIKQ